MAQNKNKKHSSKQFVSITDILKKMFSTAAIFEGLLVVPFQTE